MANERDEDLSELDGDAVHDRIRELVDEGWKPAKLTLTREDDPREDSGAVLRDEPHI
jgi:hypothetical protein